MKSFEIYDEENSLTIGTLLYYEKSKTFIIELCDYLDEWNAPLLMTSYVKKGIFSIPRSSSRIWVQERIIPSERQNIGSILKNHRLKEYDEMKFLELSRGRCSQDSMIIRKQDSLPEYVTSRMLRHVRDFTLIDDTDILCFFYNGSSKKVSLSSLEGTQGADKLLGNSDLFHSCTIGPDGFFLTFADSIDIPAWLLYQKGQEIPIQYEDFLSFARQNLVDTTSGCEILNCSRQNLSYMVSQQQLSPVQKDIKGNLYLKKDIIKNLW